MSDFDEQSRIDRFEKRRKNTKSISILLVTGAILIVVFIGFMIFGEDDESGEKKEADNTPQITDEDNKDQDSNQTNADSETSENEQTQSDDDQNEKSESKDSENDDKNTDHEAEQLETDDDNVIEAFTRNWEPIGTEQTGPHTVTYDDGSQDREEMEEAMQVATGINKDDILYLWLQNNGDQKVLATFSDRTQTQHYRVYLTWVEDKGWKPERVDVLQKNDQMYRFES